MVKLLRVKDEVYKYIDKMASEVTFQEQGEIMKLPPVAEMKKNRVAEVKPKEKLKNNEASLYPNSRKFGKWENCVG